CGVAIGLAPGWQMRSVDVNSGLADTSRAGDSRRSHRLRGALVVAELSLAVVLLTGAALMIRSVRNLAALHPGFDPGSVLTLALSIPRAQTVPVVYGNALLERLRVLPGIAAIALSTDVPLDGNGGAVFYTAEGQPSVTAQNMPRAYFHRITPG